MKNGLYILNANGEPVAEPDLLTWARWMEKHERRVAFNSSDNVIVSTIFLGADHAFGGGPPILWETMVFAARGENAIKQDRCSGSREQAEAMHARMVERVKRAAKEATK